MDDYAHWARNITLVPKFQTRVDLDQEAFEYYSFKADRSLKIAKHYEQILASRDINPVNQVTSRVSVTSLQRESNRELHSSAPLLHKTK